MKDRQRIFQKMRNSCTNGICTNFHFSFTMRISNPKKISNTRKSNPMSRLQPSNVDLICCIQIKPNGHDAIGVNFFNQTRSIPNFSKLNATIAQVTNKFTERAIVIHSSSIGSNQSIVNFVLSILLQGHKVDHERNAQHHVSSKGN